ncbi:MAG: transposase [Chlorobium sp.]|nr:transposase [Chlorobium sp.]
MGARMLRDQLNRAGLNVGRKHVGALMKRMGVEALHRKPGTSKKHPGHKIYPYLLLGIGHQPSRPGLGAGHDVYPHGQRVCLPYCRY